MASSGADSVDTELFSEVLRVQHKVFYVDLKENARGKYLKVAEKGKFRPKSSCVIPLSGLAQFIALFDYYMEDSAEGEMQPRDMFVEQKVFSFSVGENERGRFLRVLERGGGFPTGGSSLLIPLGWGNANLKRFRDCLGKIAAMLQKDPGALALLQEVDACEPEATEPTTSSFAAGSVGRSGSAAGDVNCNPAQCVSGCMPSSQGVESVVLDSSREGGPVLSVAGNKHFFFDVRINERGHYLKIKEVSGALKNLLVIPLHAVPKFQEALTLALLSKPMHDPVPSVGAAGRSSSNMSSAPMAPDKPSSQQQSDGVEQPAVRMPSQQLHQQPQQQWQYAQAGLQQQQQQQQQAMLSLSPQSFPGGMTAVTPLLATQLPYYTLYAPPQPQLLGGPGPSQSMRPAGTGLTPYQGSGQHPPAGAGWRVAGRGPGRGAPQLPY